MEMNDKDVAADSAVQHAEACDVAYAPPLHLFPSPTTMAHN